MKRMSLPLCGFLLIALVGGPSVAFLQSAPPQSAPSVSESPKQEAVELVLGKPVERELKGGETHTYTLNLKTGEFVHIEVEQKGIDVTVTVISPNGNQLADLNSADGLRSAEPVYLIAEAHGVHRLEVKALGKDAQPGWYETKLLEQKQADRKSRDLATALTLFSEGRHLYEGTKSDREESLKKFEAALVLWKLTEDQNSEARTLNDIGITLQSLGRIKQSLECHQKALPLFRVADNQVGEAQTLVYIGQMYLDLNENLKALDFLIHALLIFQRIEDKQGEAVTLVTMGQVYGQLGERQKTLDFQEKALLVFKSVGDQRSEAITLASIGSGYSLLGEYQKAFEMYEQALPLRRAMGDRQGEGRTLSSVGRLHATLGNYRKALDIYSKALDVHRAVGDRAWEAITLNNIGSTYWNLGKYIKALELYSQALPLHRSTSNRLGEAQTLNNIGTVYKQLGEFQKALDPYLQAQTLQQLIGDKRGVAYTLINLGVLQESLDHSQEVSKSYSQASEIFLAIGDRIGQSKALFNSAKFEGNQQNLPLAKIKIEEAIKLIETIRSNVTDQNLRSSYFATVRNYYDLYIDILMRMHKADPKAGHDLEAFQVSERARARGLLELLVESRADIRQGVDPRLLEQERSLQDRLKGKQERLTRLLVGKHTPEQADEAKKEIDALTDEYRQVQTKIRQTSPRYAALTQPEPLTVKQLQQEVLDSDTVLLEYALGEDKSYLWAVTKDSISGVELPKRADIEPTARKLYDLLKSRAASGEWRNLSKTDGKTPQGEHLTTATVLSKLLLSPVADKLGNKRLVVVADGALQYIPFAALPEPESIDKKKPEPLVVRHEIVSLPSASALAVLRNETKDRKPAEKTLAVLADPVFSTDDQRIVAAKSAEPSAQTAANLTRERVLSRMVGTSDDEIPEADRAAKEQKLVIPRLPYTRDEAEQIGRFAESDRLFKALDFKADRETATGDELSRYRYVHFATHGLLDAERPELSSIVLSLVDKDGKVQDGFLRAFDVYNLNLPAEVVTLSACKTGLGKDIKGEGLVGLTRGFMYAGARRVVVSLWAVNDRATAELMVRFYRKMLKDGQRPAAALRAAQVEMWRDKQWNAPFYWAGFTLQGEWR